MNWYAVLTPVDTVFVRDGRPFEQTDEGLAQADSLFPAPQYVIAAAIRNALAAQRPYASDDWKMDHDLQWLGDGPLAEGGTIRIGPALLAKSVGVVEELYYPCPAHLLRWQEHDSSALLSPQCDQDDHDLGQGWGGIAFPALERALQNPGNYSAYPDGFLTRQNFKSVLVGKRAECCTLKIMPSASVVSPQTRVGLERSKSTRTAEDGMLYLATHQRFHSYKEDVSGEPTIWNYVASVSGPADQLRGIGPGPVTVPFGGQGRAAHVRFVQQDKVLKSGDCLDRIESDRLQHFTLVALSPVVADALPDFTDIGTLVAVASPAPVLLSPWNYRDKRRGETRRAFASGTVFFLKGNGKPRELQAKLRHLRKSGIGDTDYHAIGYGQFSVGLWPG